MKDTLFKAINCEIVLNLFKTQHPVNHTPTSCTYPFRSNTCKGETPPTPPNPQYLILDQESCHISIFDHS